MESSNILKNSGDLHTHSRWSDGSLEIEHLVYLAARVGLGYLAVTDHDFLHSFEEIKELGEKYNISLIHGIELSCMDFKRNRKVHILCYNAKNLEILSPFCEKVLNSRKEAAEKIVSSLTKKYNVVPELFEKYKSKSGCCFENNILHALAECGYSNRICGEFFNSVFKGEDKFKFEHIDVLKMLELIKEAGGKSILAHPGVHDSFDLLDELVLKKAIDGVEVWHPKNTKVQKDRLYNIVKTNGLIATGGTDFHGIYNPGVVKMGDFYTPHIYIEKILS